MDQKKKDAITGLVIGVISFYFLFYFNMEDFKFEIPYHTRQTIWGKISMIVVQIIKSDSEWHRQRDISENIWWLSQLGYVLFVWYYRSCIGFWFYKTIKTFYKKI